VNRIPEIITHNYDPDRGAFRNLCSLPEAEAEKILREIGASGKRRIKPSYLKRRFATERWLLAERIRKLGTAYLTHPIYFFLGNFADGRDPSRPQSILMPLAVFSPEMVTFTYPDSMASLPIATRDEHIVHRKGYHGHVFTLDEIRKVVAEYGMPRKQPATNDSIKYDRFIEVQVWDDRPIRKFVASPPQKPGAQINKAFSDS